MQCKLKPFKISKISKILVHLAFKITIYPLVLYKSIKLVYIYLSFILQNLTYYPLKVISEIPHFESHFGMLKKCEEYLKTWMLNKKTIGLVKRHVQCCPNAGPTRQVLGTLEMLYFSHDKLRVGLISLLLTSHNPPLLLTFLHCSMVAAVHSFVSPSIFVFCNLCLWSRYCCFLQLLSSTLSRHGNIECSMCKGKVVLVQVCKGVTKVLLV